MELGLESMMGRLFFAVFLSSLFLFLSSLFLMLVKVFFNTKLYDKWVLNISVRRSHPWFVILCFWFRLIFSGMVFLGIGVFLGLFLFFFKLYWVMLLVGIYFIFLIIVIVSLRNEDIEFFGWSGIFWPFFLEDTGLRNKYLEKMIFKISLWVMTGAVVLWFIAKIL